MFRSFARRQNATLARPSLRVLVALVAVGSFVSRPLQASDPTTVAVLKRVEAKSRAVAARVVGATVGIINQALAGNGRLGEGSGVVVSEDGLILTAGHVIARPGSYLTVIFPDGRRAAAKALGVNFYRDTGLAKISEPGKWPYVEIGHSEQIKPGTWCLALGHPGGIQQGRLPPIRLGRVLNYGTGSRFLVSDATVISGDSGGPLFDLEGRVIGIHSNIGISVSQNQHVPIDVYREQWNDLMAGKQIGGLADLHIGNMPNPEKLKPGTMMVTPEQMRQLLDQWAKRAAAADSAKAKPGENAKNLEGLHGVLLGHGLASTAVRRSKSSLAVLRDLDPIAAQAARSTVAVLCDGSLAALGTVVRKDGYIVTKASEVHGKLTCRIGPRELPATEVKWAIVEDLVLLKVEANDLVPIAWAEGDPPPPGSWLITPAPEKDALGLGVVSVPARPIPDAPKFLLRNRAVIGVILDQTAEGARIREITPNLPAAKAGLRPGDIILNVDGQRTPTFLDVNQVLFKYKPGDKVTIEIRRDGKPMKLKADLVSSDPMAPRINGSQVTHLSEAGGTISKRHNNFASALTHDTVLQAEECGGPVVDLDGRAIGLNIARADRTATYAIPAGTVRKVIAELLAGK